ncbi:hypothetical protein B0H14DRAFT_3440119 [Mycena olivaceomarginata]|nr:hypothetical protein B0H14DRAFT_3440119 [Mycena olivaceomarginata]
MVTTTAQTNSLLPDTRTQVSVTNLPYHVHWQDLKDLFCTAGTVLHADVSITANSCRGTVLLARGVESSSNHSMIKNVSVLGRAERQSPEELNPGCGPTHTYNNNSKWLAAEAAYDDPEGSKKHKNGKTPQQPVSKGKKEAKLCVSNPAILRYNPYIRPNPEAQRSTLGNRSKKAQDKRLPVCFRQRFKGLFPLISTYYAPVPLAELKLRAKSTDELQRVVRIVRDLKENGKVISCSMWVVDRLTEKTIFLYLGKHYYDETDQYDNELGLGDPDKGLRSR